jgi:hypothetical protein
VSDIDQRTDTDTSWDSAPAMESPQWILWACRRLYELEREIERLRKALEKIAETKPRPALDPWNCEERLRRMARQALEGMEVG